MAILLRVFLAGRCYRSRLWHNPVRRNNRTLIGLLSVLLFLWSGFAPWSVGVGLFFGAPLLIIAVMLYLIAVVRDLRQRGAL